MLAWEDSRQLLSRFGVYLKASSEFVPLNMSLLDRGCQVNAVVIFNSDKQIHCNSRFCADLSVEASLYRLVKASWHVMSKRTHLSINVLAAC